MKSKPKFDNEIAARTAVIGLIVGFVTGPKVGLDAEAGAAIGTLAGLLYDWLIYKFKTRADAG